MELDFSNWTACCPRWSPTRQTGRVLMLGFLNEEAWLQSLETGFVTFWSRSRNKLWTKGETSGHKLRIREIRTDCDFDSREFRVEAIGPGVCHEGFRKLLLMAASKRRMAARRDAGLRSGGGLRAVKLKLGIPKGSLENATIDLFRRAGLQHHHQQPFLFPGDRRSGNRVHADPRAGDGALCGGRHSGRGADRARLGGGE